jgi:serine/threonine-protein kinase HipA
MSHRTLDVCCFNEHAGVLSDHPDGLQFAYSEHWRRSAMLPLSQSLPLEGSFSSNAVTAFFAGLLPEGVPREQAARNLGVSASNDFAMLAALGGDTAGALSLLAPGQQRESASGDVRWLDHGELAALIDEIPARPMRADADGEYRLSLAGAQDKLPVVVANDGRIGLTHGRTPSTHILKTPIARLDSTIANETLCPAIGRELGIHVVNAQPLRQAGREFLLVQRYDRQESGSEVTRLHQEDFCQALSIPPSRKYQAEGGPGLDDCFALLRRAAAVPAREVLKLLDAVILSFLVGNHDAHGKNYSLLYLPHSPAATLSPAYDLLSTAAYPHLTRKMAMSIGREYTRLHPGTPPRQHARTGRAQRRRRATTHPRARPRRPRRRYQSA